MRKHGSTISIYKKKEKRKEKRGRELERVFFLFGVGPVGMQGRVFLVAVVVLKESKKR